MVRKTAVVVLLVAGFAWFSGCGKSSSPVAPRVGGGNAGLTLPMSAVRANLKARNVIFTTGSGLVKVWCHAVPQAGGAAVDGQAQFDLNGNDNPTLSMSLPSIGQYLVSLEVFGADYNPPASSPVAPITRSGKTVKAAAKSATEAGSNGTPILLGADMVDVKGPTALTMQMGRLDSYCYRGYVYDGEGSYNYTFNQGAWSSSGPADLGIDNNGSLMNPLDSTAFITYLGNVELVQAPLIPADAKFSTTSLEAKGAPVSVGDVFGVRCPTRPNALVWLQVNAVYYNGDIPSEIDFCFRYNDDGYRYYRFDMTAYGQMSCNDAVNQGANGFLSQRSWYGRSDGIDVDPSGNVYVADSSNAQVAVVEASGNTRTIGSGTLSTPRDVAVSRCSGPLSLFVLDSGSSQVKAFDTDGNSLGYFDLHNNIPQGIATDAWGYVYVSFADYTLFNGVVKYNPADSTSVTVVYNTMASSDTAAMNSPRGLAVDESGNLYVADSGNSRVQVYGSDGAYKRSILNVDQPQDVAFDSAGYLWVAAYGQVYKFTALGTVLTGFSWWNDSVGAYYYFTGPLSGLAYGNGRLFVSDYDGESMGYVDTFQP